MTLDLLDDLAGLCGSVSSPGGPRGTDLVGT